MTRPAPGWGGTREPGPGKHLGRPPLPGGPLRRVSLRLPADLLERLRDHGGGNVSAGVRRLAEAHLPNP